MALKNWIKDKQFLSKIIIWIVLAICTTIIVFSSLTFFAVQDSVLKKEFDTNRKLLNQVRYNLEYINQMVVNFCFSLYSDNNIASLIYKNDIDPVESISVINTIKGRITEYPFIDSVYVYNSNTKQYYTTNSSYTNTDDNLQTMLDSLEKIPKLMPVYRRMNYDAGGNKSYKDIFTYFMYEYSDDTDKMKGSIIINANASWLISNIVKMNNIQKQSKEKIYIVDASGRMIGDGTQDFEVISSLENMFLSKKTENPSSESNSEGYYEQIVGEEHLFITYAKLNKLGWTLLKTQPFNEIYSNVNKLKVLFILITILFIFVSIISSVFISKSIYKPIYNLVRLVNSDNLLNETSNNEKNEINYIYHALKSTRDQLKIYQTKVESNSQTVKTYVLRNMIIDRSFSKENVNQVIDNNDINITNEDPIAVCILKLDNYKEFKFKYNERDQEAYKFLIINIVTEIVKTKYPHYEAVDTKDDSVCILINVETNNGKMDYTIIKALLVESQRYVLEHFNLEFSASIYGFDKGYQNVSKLYIKALDNAVYRIAYGHRSIIVPELIEVNCMNTQYGYNAALEKRLVEEIKEGNLKNAEEVLMKILNEMAGLNYNNIIMSVIQLMNTIRYTAEDLNRTRIEPIGIDFYNIMKEVFESETLKDIENIMMQIIYSINSYANNANEHKYRILVGTIKEIVSVDYVDNTLCLQQIASRLKLSTKHVARVFSGVMGMSVGDYINEIRLEKAAEWLNKSTLSISEILVRIGMDNESYFYKLFKKKFGVTPRQYVFKNNIDI